MVSLAERLAKYATSLKYDQLDETTVHEVRRRLLDSFACACGAYRAAAPKVARRLAATVTGDPGARYLGGGDHRTSPELAAFINGVLFRYLDYNDTYLSFAYRETLDEIRDAGLFKTERIISTPQRVEIAANGQEVLNFCANNYLGLADDADVIAAAHRALDEHGFGMASVRFICGTQDLHQQLENTISAFYGSDDTILYPSCFDANGGLFETILDKDDAVISDALNHASIIDGIRLSKAERHRYPHGDMAALEQALQKTGHCKQRLIATDGVFSMDGTIAKLDRIVELARRYDAMVMVDDCHATGFLGATGRGTAEHLGVLGDIDIHTSTLGKALGGASGGYTTGRQEIIDLLRQRSRPYLFSNSVAPPIVGASIEVFRKLEASAELRERLMDNARYFRERMSEAGFDLKPGSHPITPVMLYDAKLSQDFAARLLDEGIYAIGFFYPVVPDGQARIRVQVSAAHTREHLDRAIAAFIKVGKELSVI